MTGLHDARREAIHRLLADYPAYDGELHEEKPHEYWMHAALTLAQYAADEGEVPVGCVIVRRNSILTADCNGRETFKNAAYHAETAAISHACELLHGWRLTECTLYVTLEPCPMCAGAIVNARVPAVVIGAKDAKAGAMGSLLNFNAYPLNHKPAVTFGVLENECRTVMQEFFMKRRKKP
ncbi:MAG: tRNA adenosine(34) deaminase TadA [Clostridia bacterium]|nr:tRNA adenosine(34) deaminase TadA [Clostridia bacterium]